MAGGHRLSITSYILFSKISSKDDRGRMKKLLFAIAMLSVWLASPVLAQELFLENGFYMGLGPNATFMSRQKKINYGLAASDVPLSPTTVRDVAASPAVSIGYKFNNSDSVSLKGGEAHYSLSRSFVAPVFQAILVDGSAAIPLSDAGRRVDLDWKSNVYSLELEYQRKLWSDDLAGILGLLGFKYRYEAQKFKANASSLSGSPIDNVDEKLKEHLYGPTAGLKLSFRPGLNSSVNINLSANFGYLFKSADFRAMEITNGSGSFAANDHSTKGTAISSVGLDLVYSINKNWSLGGGYGFNWIHKAAHIFNDNSLADGGDASKIINSSILSQNVGVKLIYKF